MDVFWTKGFEATSMADLMAATQLSKSSLYQTFESKRGLFRRSLGRYADDLVEHMRASLQALGGAGFLRELLHGVAAEAGTARGQRGCLVMNSATELGQSDPELAPEIAAAIARFQRVYEDAVEDACDGSDRDAATVAQYLLTCTAGLKTMIKGGASAAQAKAVAAQVLTSLGL